MENFNNSKPILNVNLILLYLHVHVQVHALTNVPTRPTHPEMTGVFTRVSSTVMLASTDPLANMTTRLQN